MTWKMKMQDVREEGWEEGREEGRIEGRQEGREEVREEVRGMVNMLKQKNVAPEQIIQMLCEQLSSQPKKPQEE